MKRYTVSQARERLADILDAAEQGQTVVIERRGVLFGLQTTTPGPSRGSRAGSLIEYVDPAVDDGQWRWEWRPKGLAFTKARTRQTRKPAP